MLLFPAIVHPDNNAYESSQKGKIQFHLVYSIGYHALAGETALSLQFHLQVLEILLRTPLVMTVFTTNSHCFLSK